MSRSYSFFPFLAVIFLLVSPRAVPAQPVPSVDVFPLAVGNQWTYRYDMSITDVIQEKYTTEVGTARYSILSRITEQDSTRWVFQEFRYVVRCINFIFLPGRDTCYRFVDSLQFEIVEMLEGRHRLWRQGMFDDVWSSVFPFTRDLTDTTAIYRYQPVDSTLTHTFETHPPGQYPLMTFFLSFRKDTGLVRVNAQTRFLTGSFRTTDHQLMGAVITGVDEGARQEEPGEFRLEQNYPNPFNPSTNVEFRLKNEEFVSLKVFDVLGREVATLVNEVKAPGEYTVSFDGSSISSGVYFCRLQTGAGSQVRKMVLMR